jgi:hypothetical protein
MNRVCILFLILLRCLISAKATHISGMDLSYRYIVDSTGIPHHYQLMARFYRDISGTGAPSNINLTMASSCYPQGSLILLRTPGVPQGQIAPTLNDCVDVGSSTGTKRTSVYFFQQTTILPGECGDFVFSWTCGVCRNPANNAPFIFMWFG